MKKLEVSQEETLEISKKTIKLAERYRPVYLYIKMHNVTGLLYFGRTIQEPYEYAGSGLNWTKHLETFGYNVTTIWLRKFDNENDPRLGKMARRISSELDIVDSERFANTVPETGHNKAKTLPSQEYLKECFDYNADTGELFWKVRPLHHFKSEGRWRMWNAQFSGKKISYINNTGYHAVGIGSIRYLVHRINWKIKYGEDPKECIDHIDGNKLNNRIDNLREASKLQNKINQMVTKNNTLGVKGVSYANKHKSYQTAIAIDGKRTYLGSFNTIEEASLVYQAASLKYHGEFSTVDELEYLNGFNP